VKHATATGDVGPTDHLCEGGEIPRKLVLRCPKSCLSHGSTFRGLRDVSGTYVMYLRNIRKLLLCLIIQIRNWSFLFVLKLFLMCERGGSWHHVQNVMQYHS